MLVKFELTTVKMQRSPDKTARWQKEPVRGKFSAYLC